jgi:hypothetical protein
MSRSLPTEFLKHLETRVVIAGGRRVARRFVLGYGTAAAIRLSADGARRALSRRQLGRLIDSRRIVS